MPDRAGAVHIKGRLRMVSPDLSADEIVSRVGGDFWRKILFYESVDSTNDVAAGLITKNSDTESGTLVIADAQEKGKGRCGRKWLSPGIECLHEHYSEAGNPPSPECPSDAPYSGIVGACAATRYSRGGCLHKMAERPCDMRQEAGGDID